MRANRIALTTLMGAGGQALKKIEAFPPRMGSCGMNLFSAPAGSGQTTLFQQYAAIHGCAVINVHAGATVMSLLNEIFATVSGHQIVEYFDGRDWVRRKIVEELKDQGAPTLIFDNADRLAAGTKLLDAVRDLGDCSGSPIVLSCIRGQRGLRDALANPQNVFLDAINSRVVLKVELSGPSIEDAQLLASELAEIEIEPKLVTHFFAKNGASARSLLRAFANVEEIAAASGLMRIGLADWLTLTGEKAEPERALPPPRKAIAAASKTILQPSFNGAEKVA